MRGISAITSSSVSGTWLGGALFASGYPVAGLLLTALCAGWLAIIYATLTHELQQRKRP